MRAPDAHLIINRHPFIDSPPHFPLVSRALGGGLRQYYGVSPDGKSFDE